MMLQSIRLHPFAGIADKSFSFEKGFTVICGPNEEGKSTVIKALRQVLFLETSLTPAKKTSLLKGLLPIAGGDTIRITLTFLFEGAEYTLAKQWGATSAVELKSTKGVTLTNSTAVHERINEVLPANQSVVEQVLIASQSQLADAVDKLSDNVQSSLSDQLRTAVLKGGGVSATQLEDTINSKIEAYFGRWNEAAGSIEGGAGRGLANPWKNGVGKIAAGWYEFQRAAELETQIVNYDTENNRLQTELNKYNEEINTLNAYLGQHSAAYKSVNDRIAKDGELEKFKTALEIFKNDAKRWPVVDAELSAAKTSFNIIQQELQDIKQELAHARLKQAAKNDLEKLSRAADMNKKVAEAELAVKGVAEISVADVTEAKAFQKEIERCHLRIDGQKLRLQINPSVTGALDLSHSGGQNESLSFTAGEILEKEVSGKIAFNWQGVSFTVQSANEDIETLEVSLGKANDGLQGILRKYNQPSAEALTAAAEQYKTAVTEVARLKSNLQAVLGNDSFEALQKRCNEAGALPGTRDVNVLDDLMQLKSKVYGQNETHVANLRKEIDVLVAKHVSIENLDERRMKGFQAVRDKEKELDALAPLPAGYVSAAEFQKAYAEAIDKERTAGGMKHALELEKRALQEPSMSMTDAKEQTRSAKQNFEQALLEGKAYRRIQAALESLLATADSNAFLPLHKKTEAYLERLSSGRFNRIPFDATQPQQLEGDNISLPISLLSKGTKDILALSLRLAAADLYLESKGGFVVMDDPLVDMDTSRRKAAAEVLSEFAGRHQTIIFTCHEAHAALFVN